MKIEFNSIGTIHTPYKEIAPFRPDENEKGIFFINVDKQYQKALFELNKFQYIIVYFYFDRSFKKNLVAHPPNYNGKEVGLFASRSPNRLNGIGMDIVKLIRIERNIIYTSCLDVFDNTPLLDIKPYIENLDSKPQAGNGWMDL
ncbi:MAG: tRNA (N6-threonylcarbamoyladenosine(37)-N6)-methyltransferase TrmO [Bacteroidales bacterium]|nr:tRNA (N6-threonylcarbamoyladenosine(37)-N6)-methyltransferase TrmO [Bacteroidales bacterium]